MCGERCPIMRGNAGHITGVFGLSGIRRIRRVRKLANVGWLVKTTVTGRRYLSLGFFGKSPFTLGCVRPLFGFS